MHKKRVHTRQAKAIWVYNLVGCNKFFLQVTGMRYSELLPFGLSNHLKLETKRQALEGVLGVSCTKNEYNAKGVGESLDQGSQSNYITGVKQGFILMPLIMQLILIYTNVVSLVELGWSLTQVLESKYYRYTHKHQSWMLLFLPILGVNLTYLGGNFWWYGFCASHKFSYP